MSEARLRKWVEMISIPRHFQAQREDNEATALWLATQLKDWGYEVQLQGAYHNVVAVPQERSGEIDTVGSALRQRAGNAGGG